MPVNTFLLSSTLSRYSDPAQHVFSMGDRLYVKRVTARGCSAKMIQLFTFRDRPVQLLVNDLVTIAGSWPPEERNLCVTTR